MTNNNIILDHIRSRAESRSKFKTLVDDISMELVKYYSSDTKNGDTIDFDDINHLIHKTRFISNAITPDFDVLKLMLYWQYRYYLLSGSNDENIKERYLDMWEDHIESYNIFSKIGSKVIGYNVQFTISMNQPLAVTIKNIESFSDSLKITANVVYALVEKLCEDHPYHGMKCFWVFYKDVIGNEVKWRQVMDEWDRYHYIYTNLKKFDKKADFIRYLIMNKQLKDLNLSEADMPNSIHRIDKLVLQAERLARAAQTGTFPA